MAVLCLVWLRWSVPLRAKQRSAANSASSGSGDALRAPPPSESRAGGGARCSRHIPRLTGRGDHGCELNPCCDRRDAPSPTATSYRTGGARGWLARADGDQNPTSQRGSGRAKDQYRRCVLGFEGGDAFVGELTLSSAAVSLCKLGSSWCSPSVMRNALNDLVYVLITKPEGVASMRDRLPEFGRAGGAVATRRIDVDVLRTRAMGPDPMPRSLS